VKFVSTLFAAVLLLTANVAEAKPKAKPEAKATFICAITDLKIVGTPDARGWMTYNALVRMGCTNTGKKVARIELAHVFLEDEEYEWSPSDDFELFSGFYANDPDVEFMRRGNKTAPGKSSDFVFSFEDVRSMWGVDLVLDIDGTKYPLPVLPH
jgi:hypothetical protein